MIILKHILTGVIVYLYLSVITQHTRKLSEKYR